MKNILGSELKHCCYSPLTGFYRDGFCKTGPMDTGTHTVCAQITSEFLNYTLEKGNDLITPIPHWSFPGLKPGDFWCLCVSRWLEAEKAGIAPKLKLDACHEKCLEYAPLSIFKKHAILTKGNDE